eukprot:CAMPEP_0176028422 /NCGR_PEP_ID=MMETSP0120_2-20121206/13950_1 /TAXON_ID=160619 /ORGANISM="Kryptoperidinium foliaceum, Strain CCMP 1326" /LENGTH=419 /DNA_ID=CAMNT_0017361633 /DNA_START=87 /DNA_END=1346 /DNA_ORIENTATION=+
MGKRGNENSQLSKEEYEALESTGDPSASGSFARASAEVLAQRRIIRRTRKPSSASPNVSNFGGGSSSQAAPAGGGVFANVKLSGSSSGAPSASSVPRFALPASQGASMSGSKNAFASVKLTPAAPKPPSSSGGSGNTTNGSIEAKRDALIAKFKKHISNAPLRQDHSLATLRFLSTMNALDEEEMEAKENKSSVGNDAAAHAPSPAKLSPAPASAPSLFSPAPAPAFSFGSSPAPAPASKPSFSFGSTTSSATTESPAPASSGFNFAPAPTSAAPVPGANVKVSLSPVPEASTNAGEETDEAAPEEEKKELESADGDWDLLMTVKVRLYHYRSEEKKAVKFATGPLKVQQLKTNPKSRRMVLRESSSGSVLFNVGIFEKMSFNKSIVEYKAPGKKPIGNHGSHVQRERTREVYDCLRED